MHQAAPTTRVGFPRFCGTVQNQRRCVRLHVCVLFECRAHVLSTCSLGYSSECCAVEQHKQSFAGAQGYVNPPVTAGDERQSSPFLNTHEQRHLEAHTHSFICRTRGMKQNKSYCWWRFQYNFPLFLFWFCFFLPVSLSPSRLFLHLLLCSPIPLASSLLLFSISPSYHTCSLFQSWAASKLLCGACMCVSPQGLLTYTSHINPYVRGTLRRRYQ